MGVSVATKQTAQLQRADTQRSRSNSGSQAAACHQTSSIARLQRTVGNRAINRLLRSQTIQPKLNVSHPDDPYEREADRVAEEVMRMPDAMPPEAEQPLQEKIEGIVASAPGAQRVPLAVREDDDGEKLAAKFGTAPITQPEKKEATVQTKLASNTPLRGQAKEDEDQKEETLEPAPPIQRLCTECEDELLQAKAGDTQPMATGPAQRAKGSTLTSKSTPSLSSNVPTPQRADSQLPPATRAFFEARFGADFSGVRIHQSSQADSIGALAYTQGSDIHIAPGRYDPHTRGGKELLGHELAHVLQQSDGRVRTTGDAKGMPLNDDPALEQEADDLGVRAARGETVGRVAAASSSGGGDFAQMKAGPSAVELDEMVESSREDEMFLSEDAEFPPAAAQRKVAEKPIQALALGRPIQRQKEKKKNKETYVPYEIHVTTTMTPDAFKEAAMQQVFGGVVENVKWTNTRSTYVPAESPYTLNVETSLLKRVRGQASQERGITIGEDGGITGAEERAKKFHAGPDSDLKSELMKEIDRRYYAALGDKKGTKIKAGQEGQAELWRTIRDEVLFQHEYIANLPPAVKQLIKIGIKGRPLTPADYDKLFAIAKRIEKMPAGQIGDYASKVTGTTMDLDAFEASLDQYTTAMAEREKQGEEHDTIKVKLSGLEEVYKRYKEWRVYPPGKKANQKGRLREALEKELQAHGFKGVDDFKEFIAKYETAFEEESANIALDILGKYGGKLFRESERYKNPAELAALHAKLGGVRTQFAVVAEYNRNAKIWHDYVQARDEQRKPGQGHLHPKITFGEAEAARKTAEAGRQNAEAAIAAAEADVKSLSVEHPVFQQEGLPDNKRIDKTALAKASVSELGPLLQAHIKKRMTDVGEAREQIENKHELIYKMSELMPQFYAQQGIKPGSIHDQIIQDKMKEDAIVKILKGIAFAIVAIALTVVSLGTATPALVAAGAGILGAGLSVYQGYESYQEYAEEKDLANVGFAKDPSVFWLVVAIVGAAVDMGAAVRAVSKLGAAAKALDAGGDLKTFMTVVKDLEKAKEITAQIARAAENAAIARKGFKEAALDLVKTLSGRAYSLPFFDPAILKGILKMARNAIKSKVYDFEKFLAELKLARVNARLGEMSAEELAKVKAIWEEARRLVKEEAEAVAKYGDSLSNLLVRADITDELRNDILEQVGRAMKNPSVDDNAVRTVISSMGGAEHPHNVSEFLAELRHVNEVASAKDLAKGSKVYSGIKKSLPDGTLRQFDLGDGIKVDISPLSEADALYRAGGKINLDEVKYTASALVDKLREKPQQLDNLIAWRKAGPDRAVSIVIESEVKWTNLLGTPDVFKLLIKKDVPLKIGSKVFDPAALKLFHAKIEAKYIEQVVKGGMTPRAFFELPEMATLDSAAKFVGYP